MQRLFRKLGRIAEVIASTDDDDLVAQLTGLFQKIQGYNAKKAAAAHGTLGAVAAMYPENKKILAVIESLEESLAHRARYLYSMHAGFHDAGHEGNAEMEQLRSIFGEAVTA